MAAGFWVKSVFLFCVASLPPVPSAGVSVSVSVRRNGDMIYSASGRGSDIFLIFAKGVNGDKETLDEEKKTEGFKKPSWEILCNWLLFFSEIRKIEIESTHHPNGFTGLLFLA